MQQNNGVGKSQLISFAVFINPYGGYVLLPVEAKPEDHAKLR